MQMKCSVPVGPGRLICVMRLWISGVCPSLTYPRRQTRKDDDNFGVRLGRQHVDFTLILNGGPKKTVHLQLKKTLQEFLNR